MAAIIWPLCAEFMGRGFSLLITGPWEGVTQQRVPAGDLRPAGRGPYGGSRVPEGKKGQCRAHSVIPGTPPGPLGWASASLSAVRTLWGARGSLLLNAGGISPGGGGRAGLAPHLCLWPLALSFLPIPTVCWDLSLKWWVLPGGVRQGTAFTHCEVMGGCGSKWGAPTSLGTSGGRAEKWAPRRRGERC